MPGIGTNPAGKTGIIRPEYIHPQAKSNIEISTEEAKGISAEEVI